MIELELDTKNLYLTSDLHLNHRNIIKYCGWPWEQMNRAIVSNLTALPEGCTLLNLGDWAFLRRSAKNRAFVGSLIHRLLKRKTSVVTVLGNHDRIFMNTANAVGSHIDKDALDSVYSAEACGVKSVWFSGLEKILLNGKYYLAHEPFYLREADRLILHGHVHNNPLHREDEWKSNVNHKLLGNYINCCADVYGFKPVLFEDLVVGNRRQVSCPRK